MLYSHEQLYIHIYMEKHNDAIKTSRHSYLEKYTCHFIRKFERVTKVFIVWGELETEQNCNILTPTLLAITVFLSRSPGFSAGGLGAQLYLRHGSHSSIFSPTAWTSCRRGYIIIWHPPASYDRHNSHSIQLLDSQDRPLISSTGCTCYLHRCISYFDYLAGSEVTMQQSSHNYFSKFHMWNFFTSVSIPHILQNNFPGQ